MKIAMPVDENSIESTICISFGRAPYFMIYDNETKDKLFLDNSVAASSQGGAGIKAAQLIVDEKIDVLLTPRCGENATDVFSSAAIKIFKTTSNGINEMIEAYELGELSPLVEVHHGNHGVK